MKRQAKWSVTTPGLWLHTTGTRWPGLRAWWRRWNPRALRYYLSVLQAGVDRHDTETERDYRYLEGVLGGHPDPADWMRCYSVEGSTLRIDATTDTARPK